MGLMGRRAGLWNVRREGGKRVGSTWEDMQRLRANPNCGRLRTLVRSSERFRVAVVVNVEVKRIDSEEDLERFYRARLR